MSGWEIICWWCWCLIYTSLVTGFVGAVFVALYVFHFKAWIYRIEKKALRFTRRDDFGNKIARLINPDIVIFLLLYIPFYVLKFFDRHSPKEYMKQSITAIGLGIFCIIVWQMIYNNPTTAEISTDVIEGTT